MAYRGKASEMYMPTQNLLRYFASKPTTRFIDLQGYKEMVGKEREKYLTSFLIELGVKTSPRTYMENDDGYYHRTSEKFVDGLLEIIAAVEETKNEDLSAFLWEQMCVLADESILGYYVLNKTVSDTRMLGLRHYLKWRVSIAVKLIQEAERYPSVLQR